MCINFRIRLFSEQEFGGGEVFVGGGIWVFIKASLAGRGPGGLSAVVTRVSVFKVETSVARRRLFTSAHGD